MIEKGLSQYSDPAELISDIEEHLQNENGFVGNIPHEAFIYLQREENPNKLLQFFMGYTTNQPFMSYEFLPDLAELSLKILQLGFRQDTGIIMPGVLKQAYAVTQNLSEELIDPIENESHIWLSEVLRREVGILLGKPVNEDEHIHFTSSLITNASRYEMHKQLTNLRTGLLSLSHAEKWMVMENGILLPAAEKAGIPRRGLKYFPANMAADGLREDGGHIYKSAKAAIDLARYLPVSASEIKEVFKESSSWRKLFWSQWKEWI